MLSDEDVERIASAVVERAREDVGIRDIIIGSAMGRGAIPLYGRETRKEPCSCCLIEPEGPNAPENRMCTTSGAIGTLKDSEEREWCSEINIVSDGRCARARSIRAAAKECKEKYPEDTAKFFECYAPAFSKITKGSLANPVNRDELIARLEQSEPLMCSFNGATVEATSWPYGEGKYSVVVKRGRPGVEDRTFTDNPSVAVDNLISLCHLKEVYSTES